MKNELFTIINSSCSHGNVVTDGSLGYDATPNRVTRRYPLGEYKTISAHSPSVVKIALKRPAELIGLLNCSARLDMSNAVEFWVNWNYVGCVISPGQETRRIILNPGIYELRINNCKNDIFFRHTVWLIKETESCCHQKLRVIIPAFFPSEKCYDNLRIIASTARKQNVWLDVYGVGEKFIDYTMAKVYSAIKKIKELSCDYVMLCDCSDVAIIKSEEEIINKFLKMNKSIIVGAERGCWPVVHKEWQDLFPDRHDNRKFINAGSWIGKRDNILDLLEHFLWMYNSMGNDIPPNENLLYNLEDKIDVISPWFHRRCRDNDQFLWHCAFLKAKEHFGIFLDYDFEIIANLLREPNAYETLSSSNPCVLHFAQEMRMYMHQIVGQLGCLEV